MVEENRENKLRETSLEAEQILLGGLLCNNNAIDEVAFILSPKHFSEPLHGRIYQACLSFHSFGKRFNPINLRDHFANDPAMEDVGGSAAYLARLAGSAVTLINLSDYAKLILDIWQRLQIITLSGIIAGKAINVSLEDNPQQIISELESGVQDIFSEVDNDDAEMAHNIALKVIEAAIKTRDNGLSPGMSAKYFRTLDIALNGLERTDLTIIAGRPGMGKSALATCLTRLLSENGYGVAFFSGEMSRDQCAARILSEMTFNSHDAITYEEIKSGKISKSQEHILNKAQQHLKKLPIKIWDRHAMTVERLGAECRRWKRMLHARGQGLDIVFIDYLQLMRGPRTENRVQELSYITAQLKILAKQLNVCIVALSQLNRGVESREDKRPMLADLRESGSIEQDADQVIFVYREEYYLQKSQPTEIEKLQEWQYEMEACRNTATLIVAKNRRYKEGLFEVKCSVAHAAFRDKEK